MSKLLLIGGASHAGKSSAAKRLGEVAGYTVHHTDQLARHPGRPWTTEGGEPPPHVVAHYASLDTGRLFESVHTHYERIWPQVDELITAAMAEPGRNLIEGSALLPALVAADPRVRTRTTYIVPTDDALMERILASSAHGARSGDQQGLIEAFSRLAVAMNRFVRNEVRRLGLRYVTDVSGLSSG